MTERGFTTYTGPTNGHYSQFSTDMNKVLTETGKAYINVYTNSDGTVYARDTRGNEIRDLLISYTMYSYGIPDASGNLINSNLRLVFRDGGKFDCFDDAETTYYYSIVGITPVVINPLR